MRPTVVSRVVVAAMLGWVALAGAQPGTIDDLPLRHAELVRDLFPPSLLMRHQNAIGLQPEQRQAMTREMGAAHKRLLELRWQLEEQTAALSSLLGADRVDERQALERADRVMELERQMKRTQLSMLIRLKNHLTPEQQASLRALRPRREGERSGMPRGKGRRSRSADDSDG